MTRHPTSMGRAALPQLDEQEVSAVDGGDKGILEFLEVKYTLCRLVSTSSAISRIVMYVKLQLSCELSLVIVDLRFLDYLVLGTGS